MLVTFSCKAYADVTLFAQPARIFLQMLGFGQNIPGAILAEDVPTALAQLKAGLASEEARLAQAAQAASAASQTGEKLKQSLAEQDGDDDEDQAPELSHQRAFRRRAIADDRPDRQRP